MMLFRAIRWLLGFLELLMFVGIVFITFVVATSRRDDGPPTSAPADQRAGRLPAEHRLFYGQSLVFGDGSWAPAGPSLDGVGDYLYLDGYANVAALAIVRRRGIISKFDWSAGTDHATLLAGTAYEVEVHASKDTFLVVVPGRVEAQLALQAGDVESIAKYIQSFRNAGFSFVELVYEWAQHNGRSQVAAALETHRPANE